MNLINRFYDWIDNNLSRQKFYEMWDFEWSERMDPNVNKCVPYHKHLAFEIYLLESKVKELEEKLDHLSSRMTYGQRD